MNIYCFSTLSFAKLQFKSVINKAFHKHGVASFTDAWIETPFRFFFHLKLSRIFYRCVDWNSHPGLYPAGHPCRIFYRCVDWNNPFLHREYLAGYSRIFYRCVDWNNLQLTYPADGPESHLLQMRGLKPIPGQRVRRPEGRIFYRCVDWNLNSNIAMLILWCRIFYRCVDWNYFGSLSAVFDTSHLLQMRGLKHPK